MLDIPSLAMMPGGTVEMIVGKGPVIYFHAPMFTAFIPAIHPVDQARSRPRSPDPTASSAPRRQPRTPPPSWRAIKDALTVEQAGAETIDGVDATHYVATVDLLKVSATSQRWCRTGRRAVRGRSRVRDQLEKLGLLTIPADIWVDGDGYLKQLHLAVAVKDRPRRREHVDRADADPVRHRVALLDHVAPASQVTDITDLIPSGTTPTTSVG